MSLRSLKLREEAGAVGCRHVQNLPAAAAHTAFAGLFGVEVVMPWGTSKDFAVFGYPKAFCVGFVGLHISRKLAPFGPQALYTIICLYASL